MANVNAIMGHFHMFLRERMAKLIDSLLKEQKTMGRVLQAEGPKLGKQQLNAA